MKTRVSTFVAELAAIIMLGGCAGGSATPPDPLGTAKEAVDNGTFDANNQFPWVGQLKLPDGGGCSAELVTPNWILTANHCITGLTDAPTPDGVTGNYLVTFDPIGFTGGNVTPPNPALTFTHTFNANDPDSAVQVSQTGPIDPDNLADTSIDVAAMRLDEAVPNGVIPLAPIAGFTPGLLSCNGIAANGGDATVVGYGPPNGSLCTSMVVCSTPNTEGRNFATSPGWSSNVQAPGEQYLENSWNFSSYSGTTHGDSGGALVWQNQVCGVNSRIYQSGVPVEDDDPQLDSTANSAFMASHLLNEDGSLKGTCNVTSPTNLGVGLATGGAVIEIDGNGFDPTFPPEVLFELTPSPSVTCPSTTQCFATVPPGSNSVNVNVMMWQSPPKDARPVEDLPGVFCTPTYTLTYTYAPVVTGVSPSTGNGGDQVWVTGVGILYSPTALPTFNFGPNAATTYSCQPAATPPGISCLVVIPPGGGAVHVIDESSPSSAPTAADVFTYDGPQITEIAPAQGPVTGGTSVIIYGSGFDVRGAPANGEGGTMAFLFSGASGTFAATDVSCPGTTWCTAVTPAYPAAGSVAVIAQAFGVSNTFPGEYIYTAEPTLIGVYFAGPAVGGSTVTGTVVLNGYAPANGAPVTLAIDPTSPSGVVGLPAPGSVAIAAGALSASFQVVILQEDFTGSILVDAMCEGTTATGTLSVTPTPSPTLAAIGQTCSAQIINETITLAERAPATASVSVSSNNSAVTVPATVPITAGSLTATFPVTILSPSTSQTVQISANYMGVASNTVTFTVLPAAAISLSLPSPIYSGHSAEGTVSLCSAAPSPSGATVSLTSNNAILTIPSSSNPVTIPAGALSATVLVQAGSTATTKVATVTATYGGATGTTTVAVEANPPGCPSGEELCTCSNGRSECASNANQCINFCK
jgi:Trypsin